MTNPPKFHKGSPNHRYTDDGGYIACKQDKTWTIEDRSGTIICESYTYRGVIKAFERWWQDNGSDKREKEFGRF